RTILGTDVIALTHPLRRVVAFPKRLQQLIVRYLLGIEYHEYHLGMTGAARAHFFISRVGGMTSGIARGGRKDIVAEFPEFALGSPETAEAEHRLLQACRIRRLQLAAIDEMACRRRDRLGSARQRLSGAGQCSGLAHEQHGLPPGRCLSVMTS